jgi:adenosylhomocysteine nucleosidase
MKSLGILVAMWEELQPLRRHWKLEWTGPGEFFTGKVGGIRLQVALSGVGRRRALEGCQQLTRYGQPEALLSLGYSAGLKDDLQAGDCVSAQSVWHEGRTWECDLPAWGPRSGMLLCVDDVIAGIEHKQELARRHPEALALDMESAAVAQTATQAGLRWGALRVIIDPVGVALPLDFSGLMNERGQMHTGKLARHIATRPHRWPDLLRFSGHADRARRGLTRWASEYLESLKS